MTNPTPARRHHVSFNTGATIFREGESGDCAYIIERGRVDVTVLRNGTKVHLTFLSPGDLFGEMALISEGMRSATVTAVEPTELLCISRETFERKSTGADPVISLFLHTLLERFHETRERLLNCLQPSDHCALNSLSSHTQQYERDRLRTVRDVAFEGEIDGALENQEFCVYYQPIVTLANNCLAGFEALVRWRHPINGIIPPDQFIAFAERSGQIVPIGSWVFEQACRAQKQLIPNTNGAIPFISINLSSKQFNQPDLVGIIKNALTQWQTDPTLIKMEITESLLMDNPQFADATLRELKRLGLTIAIDDFGTGYSSFNYLMRFPFDSLKIDRSFIETMLNDRKSLTIVRSLTTLARSLGLTVIAEGVATNAQADLLRELECDYGQGDCFSAPLPIAAASQLMATSPNTRLSSKTT